MSVEHFRLVDPRPDDEVKEVRVEQVPSVRRMVSYWSHGSPDGKYQSEDRAAVVTGVDEPGNPTSSLSLCVLNPTGMFFNLHVPFSATPKAGCWSWPPRV